MTEIGLALFVLRRCLLPHSLDHHIGESDDTNDLTIVDDRVNVYEVMEKPIIGVDPDMDIRYCARLFDRFRISRSPVVDHGKVIGVVGFTDMVIKGMRQQATTGDEQS